MSMIKYSLQNRPFSLTLLMSLGVSIGWKHSHWSREAELARIGSLQRYFLKGPNREAIMIVHTRVSDIVLFLRTYLNRCLRITAQSTLHYNLLVDLAKHGRVQSGTVLFFSLEHYLQTKQKAFSIPHLLAEPIASCLVKVLKWSPIYVC